tara:strand:+ start:1582 stop:1881 length:300 start_codon:yes stop_codon:yes gene_type:complete
MYLTFSAVCSPEIVVAVVDDEPQPTIKNEVLITNKITLNLRILFPINVYKIPTLTKISEIAAGDHTCQHIQKRRLLTSISLNEGILRIILSFYGDKSRN